MATGDCVLTLSFSDDVRMRISAKGGCAGGPVPDAAPDYIAEAEGIRCISDAPDLNGDDPVLLYLGSDRSLPPVLLLENVRYVIELEGAPDSVFDYLNGNGGASLDEYGLADGRRCFILRFRSYVGKGFLDATVDGRRVGIPFEVRSKKMGYLEDYPRMLSDIAEFSTALLMSAKSPLYTSYGLSNRGRETFYEDFLVLDYIFSKLDFEGMYRYVRENRHSELAARTETLPAGIVSDFDPADLARLARGDNLVPMDGGPVAGAYAPVEASERIWEDGYDTPENRLVKDLMLSMDRMVSDLRSADAASKSGYVESRLSEMADILNGVVNDQWLEDVGDLEMVPYDSAVLRGRYGYADLFRMHQILGLGAVFRQGDAEGLLEGQNKKLHTVYEYWCYTRIFKCLSEMAESVPELPIRPTNGDIWTLTIDRCSRFIIPMKGVRLEVGLYYNKGFSEGSPEFRSYSVSLRPDFSLVVRSPDCTERAFIVNFDAKYKSKPFSEVDLDMETDDPRADTWEYDICKMHTYRDALIHSCGSYVLFPGESCRVYKKPWDLQDWESRGDSFIPSVGAIPLTPGKDTDRLRAVLKEVLGGIADVSEGEIQIEDLRDYLFRRRVERSPSQSTALHTGRASKTATGTPEWLDEGPARGARV